MGQQSHPGNLLAHRDFFNSQIGVINKYNQVNKLSESLILADSVETTANKVVLYCTIKDARNWKTLNELTKDKLGEFYYEILFTRFKFLCDLKSDQLEIELRGTDLIVYVTGEPDGVKEDISIRMGGISDNIEIPIEDVSGLTNQGRTEAKKTVNEIKVILKTSLNDHFKTYAHWWATYVFTPLDESKDSYFIRVENIKGPILKGRFFEKIEIEFSFQVKDGLLLVKYDWMAKYGSGIFAPFSADYKDVSINFNSEMESYAKDLKSLIYSSIKNSTQKAEK
jgi:hypothetical protein